MARKHKHEDHINHEAWAIPYGDLITLLLAFFVVMYAISSINEGKYRVLSDSLGAHSAARRGRCEPVQVGEKTRGSGADIAVIASCSRPMIDGQPRQMLEAIHADRRSSSARAPHERRARRSAGDRSSCRQQLASVADEVETGAGGARRPPT